MWIARRRCSALLTANRWLVALLVVAGALGCGTASEGPTRSTLESRRAELSGASIDRSQTGALALVTVTTQTIELCTATLITPNLVLTARHCIADTSLDILRCTSNPAFFREPYDTGSLWVNHADALSGPLSSFGLLALSGGSEEFVPVAQVRVPDTDAVCGGDIAALILDGQLDADEFRSLAPRLDEPVSTGEAYTAVGFGATTDLGEQGVRRSREGLLVRCAGDDCQATSDLAWNEFAGGDGVCSGDSGGPAIDIAGRVIGVASRSNDCTSSVYSAVSSWRDFIRPIAQEALLLGDYSAPPWLLEPPPSISADSGATPPDAGPADVAPVHDPSAPPGSDDVAAPSTPVIVAGDRGDGCSLRPPSPGRAGGWWLAFAIGLGAIAARRAPIRPVAR